MCWFETAKGLEVGKKVGKSIYVHRSAVPAKVMGDLVPLACGVLWNVVRLPLRSKISISFLNYPTFDQHGFPALQSSVNVNLEVGERCCRTYTRNRPILHRKELFVSSNYPLQGVFRRLTQDAEAAGLFEAPLGRIGFEDNWQALIEAQGLTLVGHRLLST